MEQSLSYVLVTPYTVAKSRTGGVLSRLLSRISLELVGAQMIALDQTITESYATIIKTREKDEGFNTSEMLSSYIEQNLGPTSGVKHRSLLLLFKGNNPCEELAQVVGFFQKETRIVEQVIGMSIRDTYADLIYTDENQEKVLYFEPAVITAQSQKEADKTLALFAPWLEGQNNLIKNRPAEYYKNTQQSLVIIKPDNWRYASSRPGMIIDMFSRSGLRIVGIKVLKMSVAQALQFYGPTKDGLKAKLAPIYGMQARELLEGEFNVKLPEQLQSILSDSFGDMYSEEQFERIVEFMAGLKPSDCKAENLNKPGLVKSMVLIYEGVDAIQKIRTILGATDPNKAVAGTIRREFGSNIRVNAAHASDAPENAYREMGVLEAEKNDSVTMINEYLKTL